MNKKAAVDKAKVIFIGSNNRIANLASMMVGVQEQIDLEDKKVKNLENSLLKINEQMAGLVCENSEK